MPFKAIARFGKLHKIAKKIETGKEPVESDIIDIIKQRTSVRKYLDKDVSDELILEVLDAARHAPSAGNHQPWEFIVVKDPSLKKSIVEACYGQQWMLEAPVFIIACENIRLASAVYGDRGTKLFGIQDVAAACQNILLAAESLGLGTCWIGDFAESSISVLLQCSDTVRPAAIITLGYPAKKEEKPFLHDLEEVVHIERYGETLKLREITEEKYSTF
jgi:nitroreductase